LYGKTGALSTANSALQVFFIDSAIVALSPEIASRGGIPVRKSGSAAKNGRIIQKGKRA